MSVAGIFHCPACTSTMPSAYVTGGLCPVCGYAAIPPATPPAVTSDPIALPGEPEREMVPTEVLGWRAWKVVTLGKLVRLASVTHSGHWPTDEWIYAECHGTRTCRKSSDGRVPGEDCTCGLYAARDHEHLTRGLGYANYGNREPRVIGEVAMAGKVIVGSQGWKAEKARIYRVYVPHTHWKLGQTIARQYGCEVELARWIGG